MTFETIGSYHACPALVSSGSLNSNPYVFLVDAMSAEPFPELLAPVLQKRGLHTQF